MLQSNLLLLLLQLLALSHTLPHRPDRSDAAGVAALEPAPSTRPTHLDIEPALVTAASHKRHVTRPRPRPSAVIRRPSGGDQENQGVPIVKVIRRRKVVQPPRRLRPRLPGEIISSDGAKVAEASTQRSLSTFLRPHALALLDDSHFSRQPDFVLGAKSAPPFINFGKKLERGNNSNSRSVGGENGEPNRKPNDDPSVKSALLLRETVSSARVPAASDGVRISDIRKQNVGRENGEIARARSVSDSVAVPAKHTDASESGERHKILVRRKTVRIVTPEPARTKLVSANDTQVSTPETLEIDKSPKSSSSNNTSISASAGAGTVKVISKDVRKTDKRPVSIKPVSALFPTTTPKPSPSSTEATTTKTPATAKSKEKHNKSQVSISSVFALFPTTSTTTVPTAISKTSSSTTTGAPTTSTTPSPVKTSPRTIVRPSASLPKSITRPSISSSKQDARKTNSSPKQQEEVQSSSVSPITVSKSQSPAKDTESSRTESNLDKPEVRTPAAVSSAERRRPSLSRSARLRSRISRPLAKTNTPKGNTTEVASVNREKKEVSKVLGLLGRIRNRARRPPSFISSRKTPKNTATKALTSAAPTSATTTTKPTETTTPTTTTTTTTEAVTTSTTALPKPPTTTTTTTTATTTTVKPTSSSRVKETPKPRPSFPRNVSLPEPPLQTTTPQPISSSALPQSQPTPIKTDNVPSTKAPSQVQPLPSKTIQSVGKGSTSGTTRPQLDLKLGPDDDVSDFLSSNTTSSSSASLQKQGLKQRPDALRRTVPSTRGGDLSSRLQQRRHLFSFRGKRPPLPLLLSTVREALPALVSKNPNGSNFTLNVTFPPSTPRALLEAEKLIPPAKDGGVESKVLGTSLSTSVSIAVSPLEFRLRKRVKLPTSTDRPISQFVDSDSYGNDQRSSTGEKQDNDSGQERPIKFESVLGSVSRKNAATGGDERSSVGDSSGSDIINDERQSKLKRPGPENSAPDDKIVIELKPKLPAPFIAINSRDRKPLRNSPPIAPVPKQISRDRVRQGDKGESQFSAPKSSVDITEISSLPGTSTLSQQASAYAPPSSQGTDSPQMDHTYLQGFLANSQADPRTEPPATSSQPTLNFNARPSGTLHRLQDHSISEDDILTSPAAEKPDAVHPTDPALHRILSADESKPPNKEPASPSKLSDALDTSTAPSSSSSATSSTTPHEAIVEEVPSAPIAGADDVSVLTSPEERDFLFKATEEDGAKSESGDGPIYLVSLLFVLPVVAVALWYLKKNYSEIQQLVPERLKSIMGHEPADPGQDDFYPVEADEIDKKVSTSSQIHGTLARRRRWEHPRETLRLQSILGEGHFGQVWRAEVDHIGGHQGTLLVAVKNVKENAGAKEKQDLLRELRIMQDLGSHPNVVTLLGCCTEEEPILVIMEYMVFGKLLTYLRENRGRHNYFNFSHDSAVVTSPDLTLFACQVATGMEYIAAKGIIHRDLAARNVLVDHTKVCKVSDFGMSRSQKEISVEVFEQRHRGALPIRWMSPESLYHNTFNQRTDSWSFGILLWEIITLGSTPYPGLSAREVMRSVREGFRLERPDHCHPQLYQLASSCWSAEAEWRPTFTELRGELEVLLEDQNQGYVDLDRFQEEIYSTLNKSSDEKV